MSSTSPPQLRQALNSSARFIGGYGAYEQGNGLIQVPAAWALLASNSMKTVDITSSVAVDTALEQFLATPGIGVGIHDREGVTIDEEYARTYTFTRTSGGGGSTTYNLSWVGNDGTFSLDETTLTLPKGAARELTVNIDPTEYGAHSAILNLDDPSSPGIEYQTLNTVVVAREFSGPGFSHTITGSVARNQSFSYFFKVEPGTPAFKVDFSGPSATPGTGQARFLRFHPFGVNLDSQLQPQLLLAAGRSRRLLPRRWTAQPDRPATRSPASGKSRSRPVARPTSEFVPFSLTVSVLGASR